MTRFTVECTRLKCSSDELIISAFKEGIQVVPLYQELYRIPPSTAQDMWKIAQTYAVADDAIRLTSDQEKKNEEKHRSTVLQPNVFERINRGMIEPRVNNLTPLTHSRAEILGLHRNLLRFPPPLQAPPHKCDRSRWCDFHKDHGHNIEAYKNLMNKIEECIKLGDRRQYIHNRSIGNESRKGMQYRLKDRRPQAKENSHY